MSMGKERERKSVREGEGGRETKGRTFGNRGMQEKIKLITRRTRYRERGVSRAESVQERERERANAKEKERERERAREGERERASEREKGGDRTEGIEREEKMKQLGIRKTDTEKGREINTHHLLDLV